MRGIKKKGKVYIIEGGGVTSYRSPPKDINTKRVGGI